MWNTLVETLLQKNVLVALKILCHRGACYIMLTRLKFRWIILLLDAGKVVEIGQSTYEAFWMKFYMNREPGSPLENIP